MLSPMPPHAAFPVHLPLVARALLAPCSPLAPCSRLAPFLLLALGACAIRWETPTYFVLEDLDAALAARVEQALAPYGARPLDPEEVRELALEAGDAGFRLAGVRSAAELDAARAAVEGALRGAAVAAKPFRSELRFACVSVPSGGSGTTLVARGRATPGALLQLDLGGGETLTLPVLEDGVWNVAVPSSRALERRGGWIYGSARKDAARQCFRLNLLTGEQQVLAADELPADSPLR